MVVIQKEQVLILSKMFFTFAITVLKEAAKGKFEAFFYS